MCSHCCKFVLSLALAFAFTSCGDSSRTQFHEIFDEDEPAKVDCMYDYVVAEYGLDQMNKLIASYQRMTNERNTDDERIGSMGQLLGDHMTQIIAAELHCI